jgi:hypothetical protein
MINVASRWFCRSVGFGFLTIVTGWVRPAMAEAPTANDQARNLVDALVVTKLADMNTIRAANLPETPWSDDYWGLYAGQIAKRYADPGYRVSTDWKANTDYVRNVAPANRDNLSPAEKYDLLLGDASRALTILNLDAGKPYYTTSGNVETWMGLDYGWAPASFMVPRPLKAVTVTAPGGAKITFYPSDIKALATLLWGKTDPATRFIGGRCNVKSPQVDSIGRIKDAACRDTNPATWHLVVVNQIGKARRSFVMDTTYDYEVWNHPVYGYSYNYFNPKTLVTSTMPTTAMVAVANFPEDKYKATRAPGTTHIVGITMNVKWVAETSPSHDAPDSPSRDAISGAAYRYTLELDANGTIIGGEWLQAARPDFLWTPPPGTVANTTFESEALGTWDGVAALPASWQVAGRKASSHMQPLAAIVQALIRLSRQ